MAGFPASMRQHQRGITLLEVLIAMFILTVGLLSVFGLFTAGRELSARAELRGRALAFAASQSASIADAWLDVQQWQHHDGASFRWVRSNTSPIIRLPVLIDPWGLCSDWQAIREVTFDPNVWQANMTDLRWNWNQTVPLVSATSGAISPRPFARITLPAIPSAVARSNDTVAASELALAREQTNAVFADPDDVEYRTVQGESDALPENLFDLGRRKCGTDMVPALFLAATDGSSGSLNSVAPVKRTLLIFHKPVPDYEQDAEVSWPSGSLEFVAIELQSDLVRLQLTRVPSEDTAIRRSLRPGNWLLFTNRRPPTAGHYNYDACWRRMTSVTPEGGSNSSPWLVVLSQDLPTAWPRGNWDPTSSAAGGPRSHLRIDWNNSAGVADANFGKICAYAFESLVHVEPLPDAKLLNAQ